MGVAAVGGARQLLTIAVLLGWTGVTTGQEPVTPPIPPGANTNSTVRYVPANSKNIVRVQAPPTRPGQPNTPGRPSTPAAYRALPEGVLVWDGETQETTVKLGTPTAPFQFNLTNVTDEPLMITGVRTSCGCTVPKMPPLPWTVQGGESGQIDVTMKLAGKRGTLAKTVTVNTDRGFKTLIVRAIMEEPAPGVMGESDRMKNLQIASANRQAVFQDDCAACHATPALNKMGAELYQTACGICHEAEHRASMVPDLANLEKETNADYWRTWITTSVEGKLMPAFAIEHGGILNAAQIDSLVDYLVKDFPKNRKATVTSIGVPPGAQ